MNGVLLTIAYLINAVVGSGLFTLPIAIKSYYGIYVFLLIAISFMYIGTVFSTIDYLELLEKYSNKFMFFIIMWLMWIAGWASNAILIKSIIDARHFICLPQVLLTHESSLCILLVSGLCFANYFSGKNKIIRNILAGVKFLSIFLFIYGAFKLPYKGTINTGKIMFSDFTNSVWCFIGIENTYLMLKNLKTDKRNMHFGLLTGISIVTMIYLISIVVTNKTLINVENNCFLLLSKKLFGTNLIGLLAPLIINLLSLYTWLSDGATFAEEMANENIFPKILAQKNIYGVPYISLIVISLLLMFVMLFLNKICPNIGSIIDGFASIFLFFYAYVMSVYAYDKKSILGSIIAIFFVYLLTRSQGVFINLVLLISGVPIYLLKEYKYIN